MQKVYRFLAGPSRPASEQDVRGKYVRLKWVGRVAQLVEQRPFKAWVAGSIPAALTKISRYLEDLGRVDFGHPRAPRTVSTPSGLRFALSIVRKISPEASSGRPSGVLSAGRRKPLVRTGKDPVFVRAIKCVLTPSDYVANITVGSTVAMKFSGVKILSGKFQLED